jgi:hypothetical protein
MPAGEDVPAVEIALSQAVERLELLLGRVEAAEDPPMTWDEIGALSSTCEHAQFDVAELRHLVLRLRTSLRKRERRMCTEAVQFAKTATG